MRTIVAPLHAALFVAARQVLPNETKLTHGCVKLPRQEELGAWIPA